MLGRAAGAGPTVVRRFRDPRDPRDPRPVCDSRDPRPVCDSHDPRPVLQTQDLRHAAPFHWRRWRFWARPLPPSGGSHAADSPQTLQATKAATMRARRRSAMSAAVSRRNFARLFALGGSAALFSDPAWARQAAPGGPLAPGGAARRRGVLDERAGSVRDAGRPGGHERRQPVSRLAAGARVPDARDAKRRPRPVTEQPRPPLS